MSGLAAPLINLYLHGGGMTHIGTLSAEGCVYKLSNGCVASLYTRLSSEQLHVFALAATAANKIAFSRVFKRTFKRTCLCKEG